MTTLPHLLTLRHPHRFWAVALMVSIISAIALDPWLQTMPALVAIPVLAGGLLVAIAELWEELGGKPLTRAARDAAAPCRRP
ncbi:hypothetical protein [Janthinobacterium aquaticum]|uniref:hypothetical protein n=1 Tax=Janthinobacterium sp. FT58W TaxID=2654254 RepID=UPI0012652598|nr:hypothetical protein [Janthinobacterium sp. FT58W]KAB8045249.1 hypothetical protein GCM43_02195 [Janthinobacterium sp. FT58W]